jgi:hypothetical protein
MSCSQQQSDDQWLCLFHFISSNPELVVLSVTTESKSYFTLSGITAKPLKTYGMPCLYSPSVDRVISIGGVEAALAEENMDFIVGGKFGISSPLKKSPGLAAMILK